MSSTTALAVVNSTADLRTSSAAFEPTSAEEAYKLAETLIDGKLLPTGITTPAAAFTIIVAGRELGLTAMQALRSIHIIKGKPTLSADLILALVKRNPACKRFQMLKSTDTEAVYVTERVGEESTEMSFTMKEAAQAQLLGNDNWKKYPKAMLRARCIAALARAVYPDVVLGIYDPDELAEERTPVHEVIGNPTPVGASPTKRNVDIPEAETVEPKADNETVVKMVRSGFKEARTLADLARFADMAKRAHVAGEFGDATRTALGREYTTRKAQLQAAEVVAGPANDDNDAAEPVEGAAQ